MSRGPYSGVPAAHIGKEEDAWLDESLTIRREHELVHYFTYRFYGTTRNNLLDEIVSDFVGLARAYGSYSNTMAATFFGLEDFPSYRAGGRLENYLGDPPVSESAFGVLQRLTHRAIQKIANVAERRGEDLGTLEGLAEVTRFFFSQSLEELAS